MISAPNLYEILEIKETASPDEIRCAYRQLAQEYHPDKVPANLTRLRQDAEKKFKEINEAYQVLGHFLKRMDYDARLKTARKKQTGPAGQADSQPASKAASPSDPITTSPPIRFRQKVSVAVGVAILFFIVADLFLLVRVLGGRSSLNKIDQKISTRFATQPTDDSGERGGPADRRGPENALPPDVQARDLPLTGQGEGVCLDGVEAVSVTGIGMDRACVRPGRNEAISRYALLQKDLEAVRQNRGEVEGIAEKGRGVSPRVRKIVGVAYSYAREDWAMVNPLVGLDENGYFPKAKLAFFRGSMVSTGKISWNGSFALDANALCVKVQNLSIGNSYELPDHYTDIGIGYEVQLDHALFADGAMARTLILSRTFSGDTPPDYIKKCFAIQPISGKGRAPVDLSGEWMGSHQASPENLAGDDFMVRLVQKENRFEGVMTEFAEVNDGEVEIKRQMKVEGWLDGGKVSWVAIPKGGAAPFAGAAPLAGAAPFAGLADLAGAAPLTGGETRKMGGRAVSYIASYRSGDLGMEGVWYNGLRQGRWRMKRQEGTPLQGPSQGPYPSQGPRRDSLNETLSPEFSNPPEIQYQ